MKLFIFIFAICSIGLTNAWAEVYVQNDNQYVGDDGTFHIVGEVFNNSDKPLNQANVIITLFFDGKIIHQGSVDTSSNSIMPDMKSAFDYMINKQFPDVDEYSIDVEYKISHPKNQVIEVMSSELNSDVNGNFAITGTVLNKGDTTANMISVIATLYDRDGHVISVSETYTKPDYLRANDESFFVITLPDKSQIQDVVEYTVVAESEEYAAVPEFPLGSSTLLIVSVGSYIILTKNPSIITKVMTRVMNPKKVLVHSR